MSREKRHREQSEDLEDGELPDEAALCETASPRSVLPAPKRSRRE